MWKNLSSCTYALFAGLSKIKSNVVEVAGAIEDVLRKMDSVL